MSIETSVDLRARIAELGEHDPDPGSVAEKILASLTPDETRIIAEASLRDYVRHVLIRAPSQKRYVTTEGDQVPSARSAAVIDWYQAELARAVYVGEDGWKHLADCTANDLAVLVASREQKAQEVQAEAGRFAALAKALRKHQAATVRDLPAEVGQEVLSR